MSFANPKALLLLILAGLLIIFLMIIWRRKVQIFKMMADHKILKKIGNFPAKKWFWIKNGLLIAAFIFFIFALARPQGNPHYAVTEKSPRKETQQRKEHEVSFFLDVSGSMAVKDMRSKTRLEYAKEIIDEVIRGLKGESVSLQIFTSEVEKRVPATIDYLYTRLALKNVQVNDIGAEGTNISKAVSDVIQEAVHEKKGKMTTFVILTDGESTEGGLPENVDLKKEMGPRKSQVVIIGMGSKEGGVVPGVQYEGASVTSKRDEGGLQKLAQSFSGNYYTAETTSPLLLSRKILSQITSKTSFTKVDSLGEESHANKIIYDEYFRYPLVIGLAFFILALTLPYYTKELEE